MESFVRNSLEVVGLQVPADNVIHVLLTDLGVEHPDDSCLRHEGDLTEVLKPVQAHLLEVIFVNIICTLILFIQISALYKLFTYLLTYLR